MSATATLRRPAEMVPIEHEKSEQVERTMVWILPPAALGLAATQRGPMASLGASPEPDATHEVADRLGVRQTELGARLSDG